jgi:hypothetical protein
LKEGIEFAISFFVSSSKIVYIFQKKFLSINYKAVTQRNAVTKCTAVTQVTAITKCTAVTEYNP